MAYKTTCGRKMRLRQKSKSGLKSRQKPENGIWTKLRAVLSMARNWRTSTVFRLAGAKLETRLKRITKKEKPG